MRRPPERIVLIEEPANQGKGFVLAHGPSFEIRRAVAHEIGWPPKVGEGTDTSAVE